MDQISLMYEQAMQAEKAEAGAVPACLMAPEAERMIEQLQAFSLADVGSPRWHTQREWLSRINLQAHTNASSHSDEFIVELLVSLDRMKMLVHDLLVIETWKLHVLPHLRRHLAQKVDLAFIYLVLYHECTVANLLELTMYHTHAVEALPEEHLLELADWCARKLAFLASPAGHALAEAPERTAQQLMMLDSDQELQEKEAEVDFAAAMCALSITRYLSDGVTRLPMGLMGRLLSTNDVPMALVALLDTPPWTRRRNKRLEKWLNSSWVAVEMANRLKLTTYDAQVWLTLNNLVVEPRCRAKYSAGDWRRDKLLTLKRFMNELLFDQLPVLKDLQRTLDEMALGVGHDSASAKSAALMIETVPELRDALLRGAPDARSVALDQARTYFSQEESRRAGKDHYAMLLKQLDFLVDLQPQSASSAAQAGEAESNGDAPPMPGPLRVSCWRKAHDSGVYEAWCDYQLELDPAKPPEPVALEELHGLRYRLLPCDPDTNRPMPTNGKVAVKLGGGPAGPLLSSSQQQPGPAAATLLAEALLQLPDIPTKSLASDKPPIVWVNIGLLPVDGLCLQLKLKRHDGGQERDRVEGGWYAYHPVGGALTVLRPQAKAQQQPGQGAGGKEREEMVPAVGLKGISSASQGAGAGGKGGKKGPMISAVDGRPRSGQQADPASKSSQGAAKQGAGRQAQAPGGVKPQAGTLTKPSVPTHQEQSPLSVAPATGPTTHKVQVIPSPQQATSKVQVIPLDASPQPATAAAPHPGAQQPLQGSCASQVAAAQAQLAASTIEGVEYDSLDLPD